jgi:hypothetical protein
MKIKKAEEVLTGKIIQANYSDISFEGLIIRNAIVKDVKFTNVNFKNCYLGFDSSFQNVTFDNCKFFGKYISLGNPKNNLACFDSCLFSNCELIGTDILNGTSFRNCTFSGKFKNIILRDSQGDLKNWGTQFFNCNLGNLIFEDITIYGKNLFQNTVLPKNGIQLYNNKNDILINKAKEICKEIEEDYKIDVETIFNSSLHSGQCVIILDTYFLGTFFKNESSKALFEQIVEKFKITN